MPGSNMNAGLDSGPNQTWCGASSVLGPAFRKILTSLVRARGTWGPATQRFDYRRIQKKGLEGAKRLWRELNLKKVTQFLKTHRISPPYCLPSNINQTFLDKSCFSFLLCPERCRFCAIFRRFGGGHGPCPPPSGSAYGFDRSKMKSCLGAPLLISKINNNFINKICIVSIKFQEICRFCAIFWNFGGVMTLNAPSSGGGRYFGWGKSDFQLISFHATPSGLEKPGWTGGGGTGPPGPDKYRFLEGTGGTRFDKKWALFEK